MKRILLMFLFTCVLTGCMQEKAADKPGEPSAAAEEMAAEEAKAEETAEENEGSKPAVRKAGERMVKTVNGIEYAFRWCPAGEFLMGSPEDEPGRIYDEKQHSVTLTQGFWMLETEVTQAMWESVMGTTLEEQAQKMLHDDTEYDFGVIGKHTLRDLLGFQRDEDPAKILVGVGSDRPMYYVSWNECEEFCRKLSNKLGMTVSLPTEAQWEYACRAGSETALPNGPIEILGAYNAPALDPIAWYVGNSAQEFTGTSFMNSSGLSEMQYPGGPCGVHPAGKKDANAWGLRDMIGNVSEWCQDYWGDYSASPTSDPTGPNSGSGHRISRGGSGGRNALGCRSAIRGWSVPGDRSGSLGFRLVLASPVPEE